MQYFRGKEPARFVSGTPWEKADFEVIAKTTEIFPGFFIITTQSQKVGTMWEQWFRFRDLRSYALNRRAGFAL